MALPSLMAALLASAQTPASYAELVDWYELGPGRHALVTFGASGGLRLFDFVAPSFDVLTPDGPEGSAFRWQPQHGGPARRLAFERDAAGAVTGFAWTGDGEGHARREGEHGYGQAEVRFRSGDVELCATLLLPRGGGRHPAAVLLQGSGDSDRDNVWAFSIGNALALAGVAVLVPDKRGCGQSRGDWKAVGFDALAEDALAGAALLGARAEVDPARVGFVGLSQGGWVAPLAASRAARAAFAVSVSGAAVPVREQVLHELEQTIRAGGGDDEAVAIARELMEMALAFGTTGVGWDDYLAGVEAAPPALAGAFPKDRDDWRWAWYARVLDFDPLPLWKGLGAPGLIVYGAEDEHDNVPVRESVARLDALRAAGKNALEVRVYEGSGHALDDPATHWVRDDFMAELARWIAATPAR